MNAPHVVAEDAPAPWWRRLHRLPVREFLPARGSIAQRAAVGFLLAAAAGAAGYWLGWRARARYTER